jgi:pilus assembly protein CpaB
MLRKVIFIVIGLALSGVAVFLLHSYLSKEREKISLEFKQAFSEQYKTLVPVIVAKEAIPSGGEISPRALDLRVFPQQFIPPNAILAIEAVAGKRALVNISKDEPITTNKIGPAILPDEPMEVTLSKITPAGKRAVPIKAENMQSLAGMVKPGDYIDIIATMMVPLPPEEKEEKNEEKKQGTKQQAPQQPPQPNGRILTVPLFQNVLILAVGDDYLGKPKEKKNVFGELVNKVQKKSPSESSQGTPSFVTLALAPNEANLLAFVMTQGVIQIALRSPTDAKVQAMPPANWDTLMQYLESIMPFEPKDTRKKQSLVSPMMKKKEPRKIQIQRGSHVDSMNVTDQPQPPEDKLPPVAEAPSRTPIKR